MKNRVTSKDVTIGDRQYRLSKMDPRTACWLFSTLGARASNGMILSALGQLPRKDFEEIQNEALRFVFFLDNKDGDVFPTVLIRDGRWADKVLEADAGEVFQLTTESILFNLDPFLAEVPSTSQV